MWIRSITQATRLFSSTSYTHATRALSTSTAVKRDAAAIPAAPAANPTSVKSTQDALYGNEGPSASAENVTQPAEFPYGQQLASERAPSSSPSSSSSSSHAEQPSPTATQQAEPLTTAATLPLLEPEAPFQEAPVSRSRRPVGAFRGGIIGFLLGLTAVGGYGYLRVLDDYRQASEKLLVSVEELKGSTEQMTSHLSRITALETSLERLARDAAKNAEVDSLRDESRKLIESHHLDLLNLKAHVWGIEQDLRNLSKRETSVRI
ncbi:hypothetical protein JCM10908_006744 [Rhodotorula pacifica]|uniref:uncharacterized protein n=1 Tax=Rhodotorula pacifica TaxID=1495444 RepID=UPI0031772022